MVCRSVCHTSEPCKNGWTDRDTVWVENSGGPREPCVRLGGPESRCPMRRGNFWGKGRPLLSIGTFCHELCRNSWTDRFAVWVVDLDGPKEAQVQSYSPGGANVPTGEGILAPPGEYDWTFWLQRRNALILHYFYHLLLLIMIIITSLAISRRENITTTSWLTYIEYKITVTTIRH